jgi:hypothetical protein
VYVNRRVVRSVVPEVAALQIGDWLLRPVLVVIALVGAVTFVVTVVIISESSSFSLRVVFGKRRNGRVVF